MQIYLFTHSHFKRSSAENVLQLSKQMALFNKSWRYHFLYQVVNLKYIQIHTHTHMQSLRNMNVCFYHNSHHIRWIIFFPKIPLIITNHLIPYWVNSGRLKYNHPCFGVRSPCWPQNEIYEMIKRSLQIKILIKYI